MIGAMERHLDPGSWPRRASFEHFRRLDNPYFNVCTRLDLTALAALKARLPGSLSLAYHHLVLRLANELEPFRYRLDGERVRVFDAVHGSTTVLRGDDSIAFADLDWDRDFGRFAAQAGERIRAVQRGEQPFDATPERQDVLHFTTLPWIDFTSFSHARNWRSGDAVPKIAFGRLQREADGRWRMAMAIEVHHALMDGLHVGRLLQLLQARLDDPAPWLM